MVANVQVVQHPIIEHELGRLRDRRTSPPEFRRTVSRLTQMLFLEASRDWQLQPAEVETPLAAAAVRQVTERVGLVPVLRAGLGMAEAILELWPAATVWHLGLYRDHDTLQPVTYYNKILAPLPLDVVYVLDPMLATGGSAIAALNTLKRCGPVRLRFLGLIGAPEGIAAVRRVHPDVPIFLAAIESHLDERGYIVPGLGDAGDRQFGTTS